VIPLFKRVNKENKEKVVMIVKNFGIEDVLKDARKEKELSDSESNLVKKVLNLRNYLPIF
ncbi:hypothetical protein, partial [Paenisporosarcina sp.]|uniref:hypothetical protein n=1 Tax=Paenisporosarcina sp. TaxID=1932001 RepID=UPI003C756A58